MPSDLNIETLIQTLNESIEKNRNQEGGFEAVVDRVQSAYAQYLEVQKNVQTLEFSVVEVGQNPTTGEWTKKPFNWRLLEQ